MNLIKKYRLVILIVAPILILILFRTMSSGTFKYDSRKWAAPSFDRSNLVDLAQASRLPGKKLLIRLDNSGSGGYDSSIPELHITADSIVSGKYLGIIRNNKGPVIISSSNPELSARVWMIISQTGITNLFILTDSTDNESFKYKFRPDTMAGTEL
jgi:hypothetical protein